MPLSRKGIGIFTGILELLYRLLCCCMQLMPNTMVFRNVISVMNTGGHVAHTIPSTFRHCSRTFGKTTSCPASMSRVSVEPIVKKPGTTYIRLSRASALFPLFLFQPTSQVTILGQPLERNLEQVAVRVLGRDGAVGLLDRPSDQRCWGLAELEVADVRRERLEAVKDVGCVCARWSAAGTQVAFGYVQTMVAPRSSLSLIRNANSSLRTSTSRSTVTSSKSRTSQSPMRPMHSCTRRRSPSEIWCIRLEDGLAMKTGQGCNLQSKGNADTVIASLPWRPDIIGGPSWRSQRHIAIRQTRAHMCVSSEKADERPCLERRQLLVRWR